MPQPLVSHPSVSWQVESHMHIAEAIARRFTRRAQDVEDLRQVAYEGLINAARRYDPNKGQEFLSYAIPTITGEIKRHLRDHGYIVRPPRRIQELRLRILQARENLAQMLLREPTFDDLAVLLNVARQEVVEATGLAPWPAPLEGAEEGEKAVGYERYELLSVLAPAVRTLPERQRRIVHLRFFNGLTQQQIAHRIGVSQVHVSRLMRASLKSLRKELSRAS